MTLLEIWSVLHSSHFCYINHRNKEGRWLSMPLCHWNSKHRFSMSISDYNLISLYKYLNFQIDSWWFFIFFLLFYCALLTNIGAEQRLSCTKKANEKRKKIGCLLHPQLVSLLSSQTWSSPSWGGATKDFLPSAQMVEHEFHDVVYSQGT